MARFTAWWVKTSWYISFVLGLIGAWALYRATNLLFGAKAWEAWVAALGFTPLIYYLNRPFMNATPAITALFVGIWMLARYHRTSQRRDLVLASAALALAVFFRYEYVLFVTPLTLWALSFKHTSVLSRAYFGMPRSTSRPYLSCSRCRLPS